MIVVSDLLILIAHPFPVIYQLVVKILPMVYFYVFNIIYTVLYVLRFETDGFNYENI